MSNFFALSRYVQVLVSSDTLLKRRGLVLMEEAIAQVHAGWVVGEGVGIGRAGDVFTDGGILGL